MDELKENKKKKKQILFSSGKEGLSLMSFDLLAGDIW